MAARRREAFASRRRALKIESRTNDRQWRCCGLLTFHGLHDCWRSLSFHCLHREAAFLCAISLEFFVTTSVSFSRSFARHGARQNRAATTTRRTRQNWNTRRRTQIWNWFFIDVVNGFKTQLGKTKLNPRPFLIQNFPNGPNVWKYYQNYKKTKSDPSCRSLSAWGPSLVPADAGSARNYVSQTIESVGNLRDNDGGDNKSNITLASTTFATRELRTRLTCTERTLTLTHHDVFKSNAVQHSDDESRLH